MSPVEWKLIDRFKEPSSWNALSALPAAIGMSVPSGLVQAISFIGAGICLALAFFLKEGAP